MIKLSGHEASVLSFIAFFPKSREAVKWRDKLTGPAHEIASAILKPHPDPAIQAGADAIKRWAAHA